MIEHTGVFGSNSVSFVITPYLDGHEFAIGKDHVALKWFLNLADATGELAYWGLLSSEFEVNVVQRAGIKNQGSDALS